MDIQERLIRFMVLKVLEKNKEDLEILERDTTVLQNITSPFAKLTHKEAVQILHSLGSSIGEKDDLGAEDETILTKQFQTPIFIEKFPAEVKAFYMKRCSQDSSVVLGADLLAPEGYGEIIGGSEREDNYDILLKRIHEENLSEETFSWYLDLRKYGSVPHSGFGFGLERLVTWICGLHHVRESIPYPRTLVRYFP
jgi:asparaginyl-tRNA synthetase